jgi:hypothetical protein
MSIFESPTRQDQFSGDHLEGPAREAEEERRKNQFFGAFHADSEGSPTRLEENHGRDRNK